MFQGGLGGEQSGGVWRVPVGVWGSPEREISRLHLEAGLSESQGVDGVWRGSCGEFEGSGCP